MQILYLLIYNSNALLTKCLELFAVSWVRGALQQGTRHCPRKHAGRDAAHPSLQCVGVWRAEKKWSLQSAGPNVPQDAAVQSLPCVRCSSKIVIALDHSA